MHAFVLRQRAGQAYAATDPAVWGVDSLNYCCRGFALGCPPAPVPPKSAAREQGPESARADWEEGSKAASSAVRPVARCHSSAVAAVYRCTANNFQVMSAVRTCRAVSCCPMHHAALMGRCNSSLGRLPARPLPTVLLVLGVP